MRYTIFTIQVLASFVYLAAQVNSLQSTFNAMFGFNPNDAWPVIVIMIIILGKDKFVYSNSKCTLPHNRGSNTVPLLLELTNLYLQALNGQAAWLL